MPAREDSPYYITQPTCANCPREPRWGLTVALMYYALPGFHTQIRITIRGLPHMADHVLQGVTATVPLARQHSTPNQPK